LYPSIGRGGSFRTITWSIRRMLSRFDDGPHTLLINPTVKLIGWGLFVGLKPIQLKVVHARPPSLGAVALRALLGDR
jgi:hypothetical protein